MLEAVAKSEITYYHVVQVVLLGLRTCTMNFLRFNRILAECLASFTILVFSLGLTLGQETAEPDEDALAVLLRLDKVIQPVDLTTTKGVKWSLAEANKAKATVIVFLDFKCPISNRYVPILNSLAERYQDKGVAFAAVICDEEKPEELERHMREFRTNFPVYYDPKHLVSTHFVAHVTPQAFLLDSNRILKYFGAIDDQYQDRTTRLKEVRSPHLIEALDQVLAGKAVTVKHTQAIGCPLNRVKKPEKTEGIVTFHRDVQPILQTRCQVCHRPGDVAPFALLTFAEALNWADDIKEYVASRRMPPWPITGGVAMKNDIGLSAAEIATIVKWVDEGCPKGNPADAPKPAEFPSRENWEGPTPPDIILKMPETFHLAPHGEDHYRTIVFPLNNTEELYVIKTQFIPGNKRIVHHSLAFYDGTGIVLDAQKRLGKSKPSKPENAETEDYGPGYDSGMGLGFIPNPLATKNKDNRGGNLSGWVPGQVSITNPEGVNSVLPPDSNAFMQIHYQRTGRPETDSGSRLAIWLSKSKLKKYATSYIADTSFRMIPTGISEFKSTGARVVSEDCHLWFMSPHMHLLGKEFRVWHQAKGVSERKLILELKNWDFNWQSAYFLKDPYFMEKGSTIHAEARFDNSSRNPSNPNMPTKTVFLGENTTDEMGIAVMGVFQDVKPASGSDFAPYFKKLIQAEALKKALGR